MTTIGILGGGQLARMLALAAHPLGIETVAVDPAPAAPVRAVGHHIRAELDDEAALEELARRADVITIETENVPVETLQRLADHVPVAPSFRSLEASQDRLHEKEFLRSIGIASAPFADVPHAAALQGALAAVGLPAIVKTRRFGYDGRGQYFLASEEDASQIGTSLGSTPHIAEGVVDFTRELSVVVVRGEDGDIRTYPPVHNVHRRGILRTTTAPAVISEEAAAQATSYARRVVDALAHVGVLTIELFDAGGSMLVNEIAPRVHNSGHWTIEGAATSQFENHVRAVAGLPLGDAEPRGYSTMVNLIGHIPDTRAVLSVAGARLHVYGKAPRPDRKLGHVTISVDDPADMQARVEQLRAALEDRES